MARKGKKTSKGRKQYKSELEKAIYSVFEKNPKRNYNYKQMAKQLSLVDSFSRKIVMEILLDMNRTNIIEETEPGTYRLHLTREALQGKLDVASNGAGFVAVEGIEGDIYIHPSNMANALNGDLVSIGLVRKKKGGKRLEGRIIEVLHREKSEYVGIIEISKDYAFFVPDDNKIHVDFYVPLGALSGAQNGQKVIAKIKDWPHDTKSPIAKITEILGDPKDHNVEMVSILVNSGFASKFPEEVEREAEKIPYEIPEEEIKKRRDFRGITTFTIDPVDAKDFDDALSLQKLPNGNYEVGVHIADVTHYLKPGTKLDDEAVKRATSVYLVDRVIPMLPEKLSNGVCSLRPNEEKLCFSAVFEMDEHANIKNKWFGRTVIYSDRRFTYEEVQETIEKGEGDYKEEIFVLDKLAKTIRERRMKNGSISFDKIEVRFELDEQKQPVGVFFKQQKDAHKLIEDFMLLANKSVAEYVSFRKTQPKTFVYRVHDKPDPLKLESFNQFISKFGYNLNMQDISNSMNSLLEKVKGRGEENVVETLAIRSMAKAVYTTHNIGHYGLGFQHYSHFTSPIRRYPDVIAHRLLWQYLENIDLGKIKEEEIEELCKHSSDMERSAAEAERDSTKYYQVLYLVDKVGEVFDGIVSGLTDWGMFVEIAENKCEGMVRIQTIADDFYFFDEDNYQIVGHNSGRKIVLGDKVKVRIKAADLNKKQLDFELLTDDIIKPEKKATK